MKALTVPRRPSSSAARGHLSSPGDNSYPKTKPAVCRESHVREAQSQTAKTPTRPLLRVIPRLCPRLLVLRRLRVHRGERQTSPWSPGERSQRKTAAKSAAFAGPRGSSAQRRARALGKQEGSRTILLKKRTASRTNDQKQKYFQYGLSTRAYRISPENHSVLGVKVRVASTSFTTTYGRPNWSFWAEKPQNSQGTR